MEPSHDISELEKQLFKDYKEKYLATFKKQIAYGTSGFRAKAEYLDMVALRVGVFAGIYAKYHKGDAIGVVITASHNPIQDNGIKIISSSGHMMSSSMERPLEVFVNEESLETAVTELHKLLSTQFSTEAKKVEDSGLVFVGRDTRPSSPRLTELLLKGIQNQKSVPVNLGIVTTPLVHDVVARFNKTKKGEKDDGKELIQAYYANFALSLSDFFEGLKAIRSKPREKQHIILDLSNGVGATSVKALEKELSEYFVIKTLNDGKDADLLNEGCGAEYVQKERKIPRNLQATLKAEFPTLSLDQVSFPTFDGDADRIVYFIPDFEKNNVSVLEGDKIGALYAKLVQKLIDVVSGNISKLQADETVYFKHDITKWKTGVVMTAYANGAARELYKGLGINVVITATGVKYLHKEAEKFDFGFYFEANGHGTVLINEEKFELLKELTEAVGGVREVVKDAEKSKLLEETYQYLRLLKSFLSLSNQGTGDAFGNFLMMECCTAFFDQTISECAQIYTDLPSLTSKVKVANKDVIKTSPDEQSVLQPEVIQKEIDAAVAGVEGGRAFVRPSGTEDVVRLYVEAKEEEKVKELTQKLSEYLKTCKEINQIVV